MFAFAVTLVATAALASKAQPADDPYRLERHHRAFPHDDAVVDLRALAAESGRGQLAVLQGLFADGGGQPFVVDVSASWCGPCRRSWPKFVKTAQERTDARFVLLTIERDDPDRRGLTYFVRKEWRTGLRLSFPSYAALDAGGEPLSPLMRRKPAEALALIDQPETTEASRSSAAGNEEALALLMNAQTGNFVNAKGVRTLGEYVDRIQAASGLRILFPEKARDRRVNMSGRMPVPVAIARMVRTFGLEHAVLRTGPGLPDVLALWPREGGLLFGMVGDGPADEEAVDRPGSEPSR